MKILLIGGTQFLGYHVAAAAQAAGHEVTLFHRGNHPAAGAAREILGNRYCNLDRLAGQHWDAVVDTCGYLPEAVRAAARALRPAVGQYVFISSIAAYASFSQPNYTEAAPLAALSPTQMARAAALATTADPTAGSLGDLYGALKAACEQEVQKIYGDKALLIRPGVLVGPRDPSDRLTYWLSRLARGGEVLAPGRPQRPVQVLDARDLAAWLVSLLELETGGTFNAAGPAQLLIMGQLLAQGQLATAKPTTLTWVSEEFLRDAAVAEWSELPLYLSEAGEDRGFLAANSAKALANQLLLRPLAATLRDTLAWRRTDPTPLRAGLTPERERDLLRRWHQMQLPGA